MMLNRHFWTNLKGLSCAFLLLFGTFFLLILAVLVGLYTVYLSSLWPYLLVISACLIAFLSWVQLDALRSDHETEAQGSSPQTILSTIPTITGLLSSRGSPITSNPPPPYCEASLYQVVFKPSVGDGSSEATTAANMPPPSYDEAIAIKLVQMAEPANCSPRDNLHNKKTHTSRTCDPQEMV